MASIRMIAKLVMPTSSEVLQKEGEVFDMDVMHGSASGAPVLQGEVKAEVVTKKRKANEVAEDHAEAKNEGSDEEVSGSEDETALEEENDLWLSKPSYIEIGRSHVKPDQIKVLKKLGYIEDGSLIRFAGEETTPKLKDDEIVVFKSFFCIDLQLPIHRMVGEVLKKYKVYMHQLMPNAILRIRVFIWAVRSLGARADA